MESQPSRPLEVELQQATGVLKDALAEACGTRVERADTGQLQRVEQVLSLASDAARQAVAIRRRAKRESPRQPPTTGPDTDAGLGTGGSHRVFVDAAGVTWDAFAVHPSADTAGKARLPEPYQRGWLSFDSGSERRRLSPIPDGWHSVTDDALEQMCRSAELAPKRVMGARKELRPER